MRCGVTRCTRGNRLVAMGLRAMGVADDIVSLAFGLVIGAVAVATALAFGLGGRDAADKVVQRWDEEPQKNGDQWSPFAPFPVPPYPCSVMRQIA